MMKDVDKSIRGITTKEINHFMNVVSQLLTDVMQGKRKNWRHDVFNGKEMNLIIDGYHLHKNHLSNYNVLCGFGDLSSRNRDTIDNRLRHINPKGFKYNMEVLVPTIHEWLMISIGKFSAPCARFYLKNGGGESVFKCADKKSLVKGKGIYYLISASETSDVFLQKC